MDPGSALGLVGTIIGFYSNCRDCYKFFTDVKNANNDAQVRARELGIQESILKAWGQYWEITARTGLGEDTVSPEQEDQVENISNRKLQKYLESNSFKAQGISSALFCIAETLSNGKKLREKYGLKLELKDTKENGSKAKKEIALTDLPEIKSEEDITSWHQTPSVQVWGEKTKGIEARMPLLKRCRWVLIHSENVKTLIADLKRYNDSLYTLCPDGAYEIMQLRFVVQYIEQHKGSELNTVVSQLSDTTPGHPKESMQGKPGPAVSAVQQAVDMLVDVADIAHDVEMAQGNETPLTQDEKDQLLKIKPNDLRRGEKTAGTRSFMAVWLSKKQAVYVEIIKYLDKKREVNVRENVLKLGRLLRNPLCSKRLHTMELLGMVEFSEAYEIGFVYRLPGDLGQSRRGFPADDLTIRRPRALLFRREGDPPPSLGWRFHLAKKLARSVIFLHACGWIHKNIRSEYVLFFPDPQHPQIRRTYDGMGYEHPFILGYEYSRPDDLVISGAKRVAREGRSSSLEPTNEPAGQSVEAQSANSEKPASSHHDDKQPLCPSNKLTPAKRVHFIVPPSKPESSTKAVSFDEDDGGSKYYSTTSDFIKLDIRHHPAKMMNPTLPYCHAFDVYSLGILLLEIGLWKDLEKLTRNIDKGLDPYEARRKLIEKYRTDLRMMCGEIYEKVTMDCLEVDPGDSRRDLQEQRQLCLQVTERLAQCRA